MINLPGYLGRRLRRRGENITEEEEEAYFSRAGRPSVLTYGRICSSVLNEV